jgi:predicted nuclease of restriction endonuclease-like (RecB) superfamily
MDEQSKNRNTLSSELKNTEIMPPVADQKTYESIRAVLSEARSKVMSAINSAMVQSYWEIGREINDAIGERAEYGKQLLQYLAEQLTAEFGKGFSERSLRHMRQFYQAFPIRNTLCSELSWSHYRLLMRIDEPKRRDFYLNECAQSGWTVRQLDRQIHSFFFERLLATQNEHRAEIESEIFSTEPKTDPDYILKDPYILEFLDLKENKKYTETDLEQGLIDKLQEFLLELGKGFSFVSRQKRITSEGGTHYYLDLVFYNYILKCFVVIDLKTGSLTYQDVGQLDFYVRLFNDKIKQPDDNPTIGIILCTGKDESIAKYSVLADNENLFASKYKLYLPTEEELQAELQREREAIERRLLLEKDGEDE